LSNSDKADLTNLLLQDEAIPNHDNARLFWREAVYALKDIWIYLYSLIGIGNLGLIKYLSTYLPLLVDQDMGNLQEKVHLMAAPPYVFAFVCCLLASYSSSRRNEHGIHLMFCLFVGLLGFILMVILTDKAALYVSSCIACCGVFSAFPLLLSWLTKNVGGHTKKSIAIGFFIGIGQIGGVVLPIVRLILHGC
jgi:hypothetical protein